MNQCCLVILFICSLLHNVWLQHLALHGVFLTVAVKQTLANVPGKKA
jgi:hypothetical protein